MRVVTTVPLTWGLLALALLAPLVHAVWPHPADFNTGDSLLRLSSHLQIVYHPTVDPSQTPSDLNDQMDQVAEDIRAFPLRPLRPGRGAELATDLAKAPTVSKVEVTIVQLAKANRPNCISKQARAEQKVFEEAADEVDWLSSCSISYWATRPIRTEGLGDGVKIDTTQPIPVNLSSMDSEAYELDVPRDGQPIQLRAYTALGAYRGLKTLQQLVFALTENTTDAMQQELFIANAPVRVKDKPAFPYRGLMLDTARNYLPISDLEAMLRAMSLVKLNQFHWHMTDTQSWPLAFDPIEEQDPRLPDLSKLAKEGAYAPDMVYTEADVRRLVSYAGRLGINIIIEIDMPAHLKAGVESLGNKDLIACGGIDDWPSVAVEPPPGQLNLRPNATSTRPAGIDAFVTTVLTRTAALSRSPYLSTGGDEPNLACWHATTDAEIDASLLDPFLTLTSTVLAQAGKRAMVWEDMAVRFPTTGSHLPRGTLVQAWTTPSAARRILDANPHVALVLSPATHFYLDCGFGAPFSSAPDGASWCAYVSWQKQYAFDPLDATEPAERHRVYGGESAVWAESVDATNLEGRTWPRAAAGAEVFWTGESVRRNGRSERRNGGEASARLVELRQRMVASGVRAEPLMPWWCVLRPERCVRPAATAAAATAPQP